MFNWGVRQDKKAVNAIILGEGSEKGRPFKSRFLQAGLVKYDFGVCLLQKETIDKFIDTFKGCPVVINHKDNITESDKVGVVNNIWFSDKDGWYWCDGVLTDDKAVKLVESGYNVSCQYAITDYSNNTEKKLHNGNPYDKEILNGLFEHLAIVDNPRYEGAYIAVNAYVAQNAICRNEFKENEHPRDKGGKFTESGNSSYFANWDDAPEIELKSNELDPISDIEQLRKAAHEYYKNNLQGNPINKEGLGIIRFSGKGWKEFVHTSADADKLRAVPQLPEIIKNGKLGKFQGDNKGRADNIKGFYPIYCNLKTNSGVKKAEALIAQDTEGNLFYTMFLDYDRPVAKNKRDITSNQDRLPLNFIIASNSTDFKTSKYQPVFDWIRNFEGGIMDKETKGLFESLIDALKARNEADAEKDKEEKEAENKKAKNEDVDKRDIIRQIMAIAGKREDDEDVRTIAKLAEKLAYDKSEAGTADNKAKNEDDEKEEKKDDEKKDEASNKCKNKAKNEDDEEKEEKEEKYEELKDDVKEEAENKKAKNAIDEAVNKLYSALVPEPEDVFISEKKGLELGKQIYG